MGGTTRDASKVPNTWPGGTAACPKAVSSRYLSNHGQPHPAASAPGLASMDSLWSMRASEHGEGWTGGQCFCPRPSCSSSAWILHSDRTPASCLDCLHPFFCACPDPMGESRRAGELTHPVQTDGNSGASHPGLLTPQWDNPTWPHHHSGGLSPRSPQGGPSR